MSSETDAPKLDAPKCPHCFYSLAGLPPEGLCPECGAPYSISTIPEERRDPLHIPLDSLTPENLATGCGSRFVLVIIIMAAFAGLRSAMQPGPWPVWMLPVLVVALVIGGLVVQRVKNR